MSIAEAIAEAWRRVRDLVADPSALDLPERITMGGADFSAERRGKLVKDLEKILKQASPAGGSPPWYGKQLPARCFLLLQKVWESRDIDDPRAELLRILRFFERDVSSEEAVGCFEKAVCEALPNLEESVLDSLRVFCDDALNWLGGGVQKSLAGGANDPEARKKKQDAYRQRLARARKTLSKAIEGLGDGPDKQRIYDLYVLLCRQVKRPRPQPRGGEGPDPGRT